ncbi:hypothetical protein MACH17_43170 [Phaeobacter inhibens]|uniref:S8 family serine peptidase n=1 Tax=Phaeobacter inhibens TaxID=221822 RepID=UPI00274E69F5|nr:S8 family serine peptidase [Phaeobacter inhibens]GLO72800.1 hypothetical protein MACH17_43170 [Phaeobacter inhibens]
MPLHWETFHSQDLLSDVADYRLSRPLVHTTSAASQPWWSALVELQDISIREFEERAQSRFPDYLVIPVDYDAADRDRVEETQFVSIFARKPLLDAFNRHASDYSVIGLTLGTTVAASDLPDVDTSDDDSNHRKIIEVPEGTVITAVIDDAIAFAHNLFRDGLVSSRVEFATILSGSPEQLSGGRASGRSYSKAQIDVLLQEYTTNGLLDEPAFYAAVGLVNARSKTLSAVALRRSHGTHVMALAAGYSMRNAPSNRPIICALLPSRVTEDSTGQNTLPSFKLALKRLCNQAARFRLPDKSKPPVIFNFSYGNFAGPHDGTSRIDRVIDRYFGPQAKKHDANQTRQIVLPAGNGNISRIHAALNLQNAKSKLKGPSWKLDFVAQPDDRTSSHLQMWMPYHATNPPPRFVGVRVTVPSGPTSKTVYVSGNTGQRLVDEQGQEVARLTYRFDGGHTRRGVMTFSINPTAHQSAIDLARAGRWRIDITSCDMGSSDDVQIWIERDETLPGFLPGGRQGYFNNADYVYFNALGAPLPVDPTGTTSPILRAGTLSGYACGKTPMVVAGFTQSNRLLSDYSAAGPITPSRGRKKANRLGPDAAALADDSPVLTGVLSAGSSSGSLTRMGGTSVAAPRVARLAVQMTSEGVETDRNWLRSLAEAEDPDNKVPITRTGGGQVDISVDFDWPERG